MFLLIIVAFVATTSQCNPNRKEGMGMEEESREIWQRKEKKGRFDFYLNDGKT